MPIIKPAPDDDFLAAVRALLDGCRILLDVGAGTGKTLAALGVPVKLGLDIHRPYLEHWPPMGGTAVPLNLSARMMPKIFLPKTVDAVSFIDSLEHLAAWEARSALSDAEAIARRVVLAFVPRGRFPQGKYDAWELGGEKYQQHRSAWEPEDLVALGYDVLVFAGFHDERNPAFQRAFPPGSPPVDALLAYKRLI